MTVHTGLLRPLPELLLEHAEKSATKIAFSDARRAVSYADLERRTGNLAGHLATLCPQRGVRIALFLGNCVEMVEACLAIARAGAIGVPCDPRATDRELAHFLDHSGADVVITDSANLVQVQRLRTERPHLTVISVGSETAAAANSIGIHSFARLAITDPPMPVPDDLALDEPRWLLYTSGTTGRPKGVLSTLGVFSGPLQPATPLFLDCRPRTGSCGRCLCSTPIHIICAYSVSRHLVRAHTS